MLVIELADEGNCLRACAEGPFSRRMRESGGQRVTAGARKRARVGGGRMALVLGLVTVAAGIAARVLARGGADQQQENQRGNGSYQMRRPLNWICLPKIPARWAVIWPNVREETLRSGLAPVNAFSRL